jgi:hypothetical protein
LSGSGWCACVCDEREYEGRGGGDYERWMMGEMGRSLNDIQAVGTVYSHLTERSRPERGESVGGTHCGDRYPATDTACSSTTNSTCVKLKKNMTLYMQVSLMYSSSFILLTPVYSNPILIGTVHNAPLIGHYLIALLYDFTTFLLSIYLFHIPIRQVQYSSRSIQYSLRCLVSTTCLPITHSPLQFLSTPHSSAPPPPRPPSKYSWSSWSSYFSCTEHPERIQLSALECLLSKL